jgi:hypothetical protein
MANILAQPKPLSSFPSAGVRAGTMEVTHGLSSLPRGAITEILGATSTGRTALAQSVLALATRGGEVAALIDCDDSFDPTSARQAGADLGKLLWVQCGHQLETALKAADMIVHSGGFGLVVLDLCDAAPAALQRIPISYWYRFRRAVEHTPSILLLLASQPVARSCSSRQLDLQKPLIHWRGQTPFQTIERLDAQVFSRKPMNGEAVKLKVWTRVEI